MAGSTAVALREKAENIKTFLGQNKDKLQNTLPKNMDHNRMITSIVNSMRRNNLIAECSKTSVFGCAIIAAQYGLYIDDILGHAYIVPFRNNKKGGVYEAQLIVGYKGFIHLAIQSGKVRAIRSRVVYENEPFRYVEGFDPVLEHTPLPPSERGEVKGAYAICEMLDGTKESVFMWEADIQACRARSKASNNGPWVTDTNAMRMKTTIRRVVKFLDLSPELNGAVALDEMSETEKVVGAGYAGSELSDEDFDQESSGGKPDVEQPKEIDDAETSDPVKASPKDEKKYSEIVDLTITMEWPDDKIKNVEAMIKSEGMDAALMHTRGEYAKWKKTQS